jgi:type I restriction enzyme S subunit
MSNWKTYKLGEIAKRITSGGTPSTRKPEFYGGDIPWLRTQEVNFNRIYDTEIKITDEAVKNSSAKMIDENSIIVAMYGATAGRIAINKIPLTTNQACCNISLDDKKADYNFVYYFLKSKFGEILNMATGAAQQNLNAGMLRDFEITIPDLPTQRQIAQILTSLDDKIELNLQMNQTLEAMAQAIFKEWFVNFNFPNSLNYDSDDLPDGCDNKKSGKSSNQKNQGSDNGLPKGWRMGKLGEVVDVKGGTTPSTTTYEFWNGKNYWTTPKDLSNSQSPVLIDTERKITDLGVKQISSGVLPKGTLLLSSRAPIGYLAISQVPISINQGYIAIQGKKVSNLFMLFWLKQNMEAVKSKANGSTFQEISKSNFKLIDISIPSVEVLQKFDEVIDPIFQKIVENVYSNLSLTQTRDTLLPKLMSGEICLNLDSFDVGDDFDEAEEKSGKSNNHKNHSPDYD